MNVVSFSVEVEPVSGVLSTEVAASRELGEGLLAERLRTRRRHDLKSALMPGLSNIRSSNTAIVKRMAMTAITAVFASLMMLSMSIVRFYLSLKM